VCGASPCLKGKQLSAMKKQTYAITLCGAVLLAGCQPEQSAPPQTESQPASRVALATNLVPGQVVMCFEISGMHCDGCASGLAAELRQTPGVAQAQVSFSNQLAIVTCDTNRSSMADLVKVIQEAGFEAKRLQR